MPKRLPEHLVLQISIGDWLHVQEVCFEANASNSVRDLLLQQQQANSWAAWSVIAPFRNEAKLPAFTATLNHYITYHMKVCVFMESRATRYS